MLSISEKKGFVSGESLEQKVNEVLTTFFPDIKIPDPKFRVDKPEIYEISHEILNVIVHREFRSGPKPFRDLEKQLVKKLSCYVKKSKPIGLSVGFGPTKNQNAINYNHVDWAEFFSFGQLTKLNNKIHEVYEPGTNIKIVADDSLVMRANNVDKSLTQEYLQSLRELIKSLKIEPVITKVTPLSRYNLFIVPYLPIARKIVKKFEDNPANTEKIEEMFIHAKRNLYFKDRVREQEKEEMIKKAAHEYKVFWTAMNLSKIAKLQRRIQLFYDQKEGFVTIYTLHKGNKTQPWQGEGCLEYISGKLIPFVLTQSRIDNYETETVNNRLFDIKGFDKIKVVRAKGFKIENREENEK